MNKLQMSIFLGVACDGAETLTWVDSGYGEITVTHDFGTVANANYKCEITLVTWDATASTYAITRISEDCSPVTFRDHDVVDAFGYGSYQFSSKKFAYGASIDDDDPICELTPVASALTPPACDATALLDFGRPDTTSVVVTVDPVYAREYMLCRITLVSGAAGTPNTGPTASMVRVGSCTDRFDFIKETGEVIDWTATGSTLSFTLEQFPAGDLAELATDCPGTLVAAPYTVLVYPLGATCDQDLIVTRLPGAIYSFRIEEPHPLSGVCTLTITGGGNTQALANCADVVMMNLYEIRTNFGYAGLAAGASVTFTWSLTGSGTCTSASTTAFNVDAPAPITASYSTDFVTVTIGTVTDTFLINPANAKCRVRLVSCDGVTSTTTTAPSTTCVSSTVMSTISVAGLGENCVVKLEYLNSAEDTVLTTSDLISIATASVPSWSGISAPTVSSYGEGCLLVTWTAPSDGGTPVLCYIVSRQDDGGGYYEIGTNCDPSSNIDSFLTDTSFVSCTFDLITDYLFQVEAVNRIGVSAAHVISTAIRTEYLLAAPASVYTSPTLTSFAAGSFPMIIVQQKNPDGSPAADTTPTDRLFVGRLVNHGLIDAETGVLTPTDLASLAIPINSPPAFTKVYVHAGSGLYHLIVTEPPSAGAYSLATYSLESGGLLGQYWSNPFLANADDVTQKEPVIDFDWGMGPIINTDILVLYDYVSAQWVGFIEADFTEEYTFFLTTNDNVRMWVDDVLIINQWRTACVDECSGRAELAQSVSGFGSRKFHHVRIQYYHSKGPTQSKEAALTLSWSSFSQGREVIPTTQMFKGVLIDSGTLKTFTIVPDVVHAASSVVTMPVGSFYAGTEYTLTIQAKDAYGNDLTNLASSFTAAFTGPAAVTDSSAPADPSDLNGLYVIPFVLTVSGVYTVAIADSATNAVSTESVTVLPAEGYAFTAVVTQAPATRYVNSPVIVSVTVEDFYANSVGDAATLPAIYLSARWTGDSVTNTRLTYDDFALRRERFGDYFSQSQVVWNTGTSKYDVTINLPRAGTYDMEVGIVGGDAPDTSLVAQIVKASQVYAPQYSVVVTTPFPPTTLLAGTLATYVIQLRDEYMNALGEDPTAAPTVRIRLEPHAGASQEATCTDTGPNGQYSCPITPATAGADIYLSILVDGVHAAYMAETNGEVRHFQGPWLVSVVNPANVGPGTTCTVTGLRSTYTAGVAVDATLIFYDANGNLISTTGGPTIVAKFESDGPISDSTFTSNADGSITIPVVAILTTSTTLTISATGTACTTGALTVVIQAGTMKASGTVCTAWTPNPTNFPAGAPETLPCTPNDAAGNDLIRANLYTYGNCKLRSDSSVAVATATTYTAVSASLYSYGVTLTKAGQYSCYFLMGQPGGLIAQYYSETDFTELVGVDNTLLVDPRHYNEPPVQYTQIDSYLDFDWGGPIVTNGVTVKSIKWSGLLVAPVAGAYTFRIDAVGGVKLVLTGFPAISFDLLTDLSVARTSSAFTLALYAATAIEIQYIPTGSAEFSLKWEYVGDVMAAPWVVPPSALHAPLSILTVAQLNTVVATTISNKSTATLPSFFIQGVAETFTIQAIDTYGNLLPSRATACLGSNTLPTCLFRFTLSPDDGTVFVASDPVINDGTYTVTATFQTDGPRQLTIDLITSATPTYSAFVVSSYSFDVHPSS